jgi:hypothetical protein
MGIRHTEEAIHPLLRELSSSLTHRPSPRENGKELLTLTLPYVPKGGTLEANIIRASKAIISHFGPMRFWVPLQSYVVHQGLYSRAKNHFIEFYPVLILTRTICSWWGSINSCFLSSKSFTNHAQSCMETITCVVNKAHVNVFLGSCNLLRFWTAWLASFLVSWGPLYTIAWGPLTCDTQMMWLVEQPETVQVHSTLH